jgi:hypothetical protein
MQLKKAKQFASTAEPVSYDNPPSSNYGASNYDRATTSNYQDQGRRTSGTGFPRDPYSQDRPKTLGGPLTRDPYPSTNTMSSSPITPMEAKQGFQNSRNLGSFDESDLQFAPRVQIGRAHHQLDYVNE